MSRPSRAVTAVLAAAIAALLATAAGTAAVRRSPGTAGVDRPSRSSGRSGRVAEARLAPVIAELEAFVESARGLRFVRPVDVKVLGDFAFRRTFSTGGAVDEPGADVEEGVLRALGLLGPGDDLGAASELDPDTVAGFYDSDTKELVVRGVALTPFVREVLVHELTHALDDQHFDLARQVGDDEADLAFEALVEGDAVAVERRYLDSLPPAERKQAEDEEDATFGGGNFADQPETLLEVAEFPYGDGERFVDALLQAGGQARVDAAFRAPPTTSAEVLHPERFLAGRGRAPAPPVAAGGRVVDEGVLGELVLRLVLAESVPDEDAGRAAAGWAGDRYVAWRGPGGRTCVRASVVLDSAADAAELTTALRRWVAGHLGAQVEPAGPAAVTLGRCA